MSEMSVTRVTAEFSILFGKSGNDLWNHFFDAIRNEPNQVRFYLHGTVNRLLTKATVHSVVRSSNPEELVLHVNIVKESGNYRLDTILVNMRTGTGTLSISS